MSMHAGMIGCLASTYEVIQNPSILKMIWHIFFIMYEQVVQYITTMHMSVPIHNYPAMQVRVIK